METHAIDENTLIVVERSPYVNIEEYRKGETIPKYTTI